MSDALPIPELMSPAGDWDCARAAVENGADAIYFGLQGGFNARARAANFTVGDLPKLMAFLHTRGVHGYLTLNTLIFDDEMEDVERLARDIAAAGVDAVLVQDLGLLRLLHRLGPELPLHASTQMTLSSAECIAEVEALGVRRVVLPRELSIEQITAIRRKTSVELECFVHGALCISYSGQCLASLSMGGRSANRGQCAQPCRLPYEVICDGRTLDGAPQYPLSPHDLAAYDRVSELILARVSALKIEGRLKPPEYVAGVTRYYRDVLDACASGSQPVAHDIAEIETLFSRGFCHGWLDGDDHKALVSGQSSAKRGTLLGTVKGVRGQRVLVELAGPIRRGDGVVFEGDRSASAEQGGRVYEVFQNRRSIETDVQAGLVELAFRYGAIDVRKLDCGQKVWKTDDPQAARRLRKSFCAGPQRRVAVDLIVRAAVGEPLRIEATAATGVACHLESPDVLAEAQKRPLTADMLTEQLGRLGKTPYALRRLEARIDGKPMIPLSVLGKLRHEMVESLDDAAARPRSREIAETSVLPLLRAESSSESLPSRNSPRPTPLPLGEGTVSVLCRSLDQFRAALAAEATNLIADFRDPDRLGDAVQLARTAGAMVSLATPRIHKPEANRWFQTLAECRPDGVLVRNLAGLGFFCRLGIPVVADFSLNAANEFTVAWLHERGAMRVTPSCDLSESRLFELAARVPPEWLEVVVHRHTPMFHSEYCLFCGVLSRGTNRRDCGRPCLRHRLLLRDRKGVEHPVLVDGQCQNTVFHANAESLTGIVPSLRDRGVRHFRVELLAESTPEEVRRIVKNIVS